MEDVKEIVENEFSIAERADEDQIVSELKGEALREMVYITKEGKTTLTWAGIKQLAYKQGGIDVELVSKDETTDAYIFTIKATDKKNQSSMLGVSTQSKKDFNNKLDQFAIQKAMSKAQRNAIRGLLPEVLIQKAIETFMKQDGAVKKINGASGLGPKLICSCGGDMIPSKYQTGMNYCFKCKKNFPAVDTSTGEVLDIGSNESTLNENDINIKAKLEVMKELVKKAGFTAEEMRAYIKTKFNKENSSLLNSDELDVLIAHVKRSVGYSKKAGEE